MSSHEEGWVRGQEIVDGEAWPLCAAAVREEVEEGRDRDADGSDSDAGGAADMSRSSVCQNKTDAPTGNMSAKSRRSKKPHRK